MELDISFSKDVFTREEFNVDRFLQESCQKSGLHKLHKELGVYIKYLQSMIVDLVNNESNAIVNLSSELKLLQNNFGSLETPLGQLREELMQIYKMIDTNLSSIKFLLSKKEETLARRSCKMNEVRMLATWQKVCSIVEQEDGAPLDLEVLERGVNQCVLQHMYWQLSGLETPPPQHPQLQAALEQALLSALDTRNAQQVSRCLQMWTALGEGGVRGAERLYRERVVRPALRELISEARLQGEPHRGRLPSLYGRVLSWARDSAAHMHRALQQRAPELSAYRLMLRAVWPEVAQQLKLNLPVIYAPGVPAVFQKRFLATQHFLEELSELCRDEEERSQFWRSEAYREHQQLWNLTVYMHIRQREIIETVEDALHVQLPREIQQQRGEFNMAAVAASWTAMERCFAEDVFLPVLLDKFFKLMIQIVSRLMVWIDSILSEGLPLEPSVVQEDDTHLRLKYLSLLHSDVEILIKKLNNDMTFVLSKVPEQLRSKVRICLDEFTVNGLPQRCRCIEDALADMIYSQSSGNVKHVSQIPRLYRKTNRSAPTAPSAYVSAMCGPARLYEASGGPAVARVLSNVHARIAAEYGTLVSALLTSVARTEESLRRLKKTRGADSNQDINQTDDFKIRAQVQLDVKSYCDHAAPYTDIGPLLNLITTAPRD